MNKEDINLNVASRRASGTVIRNLHVPCPTYKLNEHFTENITSLVFHKEISIVNLTHILNRCQSLQSIHLDNVKLSYADKKQLSPIKRIHLKNLKQLKISITSQDEGISTSKPASLHVDTLNIFKYIETMIYGSLEEVDVICSLEQLLVIPLPAAFVPQYTFQKADSFVEFLYNNRCTIRQLTMGPSANEMLIIKFQLPDQVANVETVAVCKDDSALQNKSLDHTFRKMTEFANRDPTQFETIITADRYPLPEWWTCILDHQSTLTYLSLTLMDTAVLEAALAAAERCCDTLTVIHLRFIGKEMEVDLKRLNRCTQVSTMSLIVYDCHVEISNFQLLPASIRRFKISGCLCAKLNDVLIQSLANVEKLTIYLNKFDYPYIDRFSIVHWSVFENLLDFRHLDFLVFESDHLQLDWEEIHDWTKSVDWCIKITHNTQEQNEKEEIFIELLPIGIVQPICADHESDMELTVPTFCSCLGL